MAINNSYFYRVLSKSIANFYKIVSLTLFKWKRSHMSYALMILLAIFQLYTIGKMKNFMRLSNSAKNYETVKLKNISQTFKRTC